MILCNSYPYKIYICKWGVCASFKLGQSSLFSELQVTILCVCVCVHVDGWVCAGETEGEGEGEGEGRIFCCTQTMQCISDLHFIAILFSFFPVSPYLFVFFFPYDLYMPAYLLTPLHF